MENTFACKAANDLMLEPNDPIMPNLLQQYERVVVETIITSFGLDMLLFDKSKNDSIKDQHGGYVDTIHNVRKIGEDPQMGYKNEANKAAYEKRGAYDYRTYHDDNEQFRAAKRIAKAEFRSSGKPIEDAYTGENIYFLGNGKNVPPKLNAQLEHILTTKTIHEDRGRVLSGLDGTQLANCPENYAFINQSLNASLGATKDENGNPVEIPVYIDKHPELPDETKERMLQQHNSASNSYNEKIARSYYHSEQFMRDTAAAATAIGVRMGVRQLGGFIFMELWFGVKEELAAIEKSDDFDLSRSLSAIAHGIERGFERAKEKYKEALARLGNGVLAGAMSVVTTTLTNIFFTTSKSAVRIIRQSWASLTQAGEVLFINPTNYSMGDRFAAVAKIIATGASVVVGTAVSEAIGKTGVEAVPVIGSVIPNTCGALVTGIMSCTLLYFFDNDPTVRKLVSSLNRIHTIEDDVNYYQRQAQYFEEYSAQLMQIDLKAFQKETAIFNEAVASVTEAASPDELNEALRRVLDVIGVEIPWGEYKSFDSFMSDENASLHFS